MLSMAAGLLLMLLPQSCQKEKAGGHVVFTLGDVLDITETTKGQVSYYTRIPSASEFDIELRDDYSVIWSGKLTEWDETTVLSEGHYKVTASYGDPALEGNDLPVFTGEKSFEISSPGTQTVSVDVSLSNSIVTAWFSDEFRNYFKGVDVSMTTAAQNTFHFNYYRTNGVFIDPNSMSLEITLYNQTGTTRTLSREYSGLRPATCYNLRFYVSSVGAGSITITFDDTTETVDLGTIDLN